MDVTPYLTQIFREFPAFTNATIRIPVQGMDHVALILDEQWIWRFPVRHEYLETFTREVELLSYLYDKRVAPIPHYIHLAKDRTFGAYAMLRGEECTGQVFANMTPIAQATLAHELAWFLTKLHVIQLQEVRRFGLESPAPDTATELYNDYTACIAPRISEDERVACQTFFTNYAHVPPYPTKTLIHGDFSWWHILVDSHTGSLSGVIDFGDCHLGDPAGDFGSLWTYGKAFVTSVYEQYAGPKDAQFLARSLLYFKKLGLSELSHAVKGEFGSWESMYPFFQKTVATS